MNLSKSKYCNAFQCLKMLWLEENKPEEKEQLNNDSILENGTEVGTLAKSLFGDFIDIEFKDLKEMIEDTKQVINNNKVCNITEASFSYHNNFCSVDILKKNHNKFEIYEVKSSTSIKDIYYEDASYQYYVLTKLGYHVTKVSIVYLNSHYIRKGKLDLQKLFLVEDITEIAKNKLKQVELKIKEINTYMEQKEEPKDCVDNHCFDPYDCPFFHYCTKHLETPNVFHIVGLSSKKQIELYKNHKTSFKDLLKEDLNDKYKEQIEFEINNVKDKINTLAIKEFLNTLSYPLYFLDFETYQQVIPLYDNISPYQKIPFQYSLHYIENSVRDIKHLEFLAEPDKDPRRAIAEALVRDIPKDVCVLAYNMGFEKSVIATLAEQFPDLADHLIHIKNNIKDLMIPFSKRNYYTKDMKGKYSIKYVLPALFPDDPSLNYHNLEDVHNGSEAMNAYADMGKLSKEEQEKLRHSLLKYCELDTYAMVKIYEKLLEVTKE